MADISMLERAGRPTRRNRLCVVVIAMAAFLASLVAVAASAAASGPPGTTATKKGSINLSGTFAGTGGTTATFKFTAVYPTWVAATAVDEVSGTITPSTAVDNALAGQGASTCVLDASAIKVTVDGANPTPQTLNLGSQAGPVASALPSLSFHLPPLSLGPLAAPGSGAGNMTAWLKSISGTVSCFDSTGQPVVQNEAVNYSAPPDSAKGWLAETSFGAPPAAGTITGTVTDDNSPPNDIAGATVEACTIEYQCTEATTASNGTYSFSEEPGSYYVLAFPPSTLNDPPALAAGVITVTSNATFTANVVLGQTETLPSNISMTYNTGQWLGGVPVENWEHPFTITATGCPNGTATWQLQGWNTQTSTYQTLTGPMTETPAGGPTYTATVPSPPATGLYPIHGPIVITITINCPNGPPQITSFDGYIDPSGTVVNQNGAPVSGATVTLYDSSSPNGPWTEAPSGDTAIMSAANTANPSVTGALGQYGWDVVAGYYQLQATAPGCSTYTTPAMQIPPPVVGRILPIDCPVEGLSWNVDPGGAMTATSRATTLTDTATGMELKCASSKASGTLAQGSVLSGTGIGSLSALTFSHCTLGDIAATEATSASAGNPWLLNANSYDSSGVTTGTITNVDATVSATGCTATVVGPSTTSPGQVQATYSNKSHQLAVTSDGGILHIWNVQGCSGLLASGDAATFTGTYTVSSAQVITNS